MRFPWINGAISWINGVILQINSVVSRINTYDLIIDEENTKKSFETNNKNPSMRDDSDKTIAHWGTNRLNGL